MAGSGDSRARLDSGSIIFTYENGAHSWVCDVAASRAVCPRLVGPADALSTACTRTARLPRERSRSKCDSISAAVAATVSPFAHWPSMSDNSTSVPVPGSTAARLLAAASRNANSPSPRGTTISYAAPPAAARLRTVSDAAAARNDCMPKPN